MTVYAKGGAPLLVLLMLMVQHIPDSHCEVPTLYMPGGRRPVEDEQPKRTMAPATYWVTFATRLRPATRLPVTVRLAKPEVTSTVSISLRNGTNESIVFAETSDVVSSAEGSKIIYLDIPRHLNGLNWYRFCLRVVGSGDVSFNQSESVSVERKYFSVFVQTDKAKYKPGQTVKFRVLAMNPNLTIRQEPMDIFVRDPEKNGMRMWRGVKGYQNTGVVEKKIPTSNQAPVGDWTIDVTILNYTETKTFTVEKYVLPKFEAKLEMPEIALTSQNYVEAKALAKYTFGKPLTKARVTVTIEKTGYFSNNKFRNRTRPVIKLSGEVDEKGEYDIKIYKSELLNLLKKHDYSDRKVNMTDRLLTHKSFAVKVNVTDSRSGKTMGTEGGFRFIDEPAKIEFLSITPFTFKPGLNYSAHVKVRKYDDSLFENYKDIQVSFNVTYTITLPDNLTTTITTIPPTAVNGTRPGKDVDLKEKKKRPHVQPTHRRQRRTRIWKAVTKQLTANGYLKLEVDVPDNTTDMELKASVLGSVRSKYAQKATSPSDNFIQITAEVDNPKVGHETTVLVKTTEPVEKLIYQVYAKGVMMEESEGTAVDKERRKFNLTLKATSNMAPNCRILAFYFRKDGEAVADSLSLNLDTSSEVRVNVSYNKQKVQPGEEVDMRVHSRPNSTVFLLAVDKSVKLLKSGNDITQDMVDQEMMAYGWGIGNFPFWSVLRICGWPYPSQGQDADAVFREAGVAVLTDGYIQKRPHDVSIATFGMVAGGTHTIKAKPGESQPSEEDPERMRTFFPETWLFDAVFVGSKGQSKMSKTAPDTITTWLTTAFAVHPQYGLSVIPQAAELTTFRNMFVSVDLPYSAIRGEDLCLKAYAHNYYNKSISMSMRMEHSPGISNIRVALRRDAWGFKRLKELTRPMRITHHLGRVRANGMAETSFCFTPVALGQQPIRIKLTSPHAPGDGIERMLLVEAEGVPRVHTHSVILDLSEKNEFQQIVPIQFPNPNETVNDSRRITVAMAADLLGQVFDNIEDLLRMPYGCGEQNMLYFAPNVFLMEYLMNTKSYTPDVAEKAERFMMVGYQKELKYKHKDGSYSAFGERPNRTDSGSMWLTAFVTKCFVQSMAVGDDVVCVEPKIVQQAIKWMVSQQDNDGAFPEPGKVFNKNMQGGSGEGEALTAYVLIALAEANRTAHLRKFKDPNMKLMTGAILSGRGYLENRLTNLTDPYDLAIVTYALHLTHSNKAEDAFKKLMDKAERDPFTLRWERPAPAKKQYSHYFWQRRTDAINIETTAYALLTLLLRKDLPGAAPVVRWLTQQRGPQGGFISTQDTVIALQGLAQVATKLYQPKFTPINVTVEWSTSKMPHNQRVVVLNDTSKLLLHKVDVPTEDAPEILTIRAKTMGGKFGGMAVAEVILDYNMNETSKAEKEESPGIFRLSGEVEKVATGQGDEVKVLRLHASRIDGKNGSMTVIEVKLPTGYAVGEPHDLLDVTGTKLAQSESDTKYVLYYERMDSSVVKASLPLVVVHGHPVNTKLSSVKIYDYYENSEQLVTSYGLKSFDVKESVCDSNPDYESCRFHDN